MIFSPKFRPKKPKKVVYGETTHVREKCYNDDPPFITILPTRDIFGTRIVNILDFKSFLIYKIGYINLDAHLVLYENL